MQEIINAFFQTAPFFSLIPLICALIRYRGFTVELKWLTLYLIISAIVDISAFILWRFKINNLFLLHGYTILQFAVVTMMYRVLLRDVIRGWIFIAWIAVFTLFAIWCTVYVDGLKFFNTYPRSVCALMITAYSITYFFVLMTRLQVPRLEKHPMFWVNSGFLLYFSCSFFLFIFSNTILFKSVETNRIIWMLHATLVLILYTLTTIGIWSNKPR